MMRIDTIIFDIGNVLIPWDPRLLYRKLIEDEAEVERFLTEVCSNEWNALQDAGRSCAEATAERIAQFPQHEALIRAYYDRWEETVGDAMEESIALLHEAKALGLRVLALTNFSTETFLIAERRYAFLKEFEGIVVSGREKLMKPQREIYELLLERFDVDPARAVFIDDTPANVRGAQAVGIRAIHFHSARQVRDELIALGLAFSPSAKG